MSGPSGKQASGMEGPPEKAPTFRETRPRPGRLVLGAGGHPPKEPFWWMAETKGQFVHQMGRFGGWQGRSDENQGGGAKIAGGSGGMAGARATLGIVRGGTVNGSERQ